MAHTDIQSMNSNERTAYIKSLSFDELRKLIKDFPQYYIYMFPMYKDKLLDETVRQEIIDALYKWEHRQELRDIVLNQIDKIVNKGKS